MNNKQPFKNLAFLKKIDTVDMLIGHYAPNTIATFYVAAVSALQLFKDRIGYKTAFNAYVKKMTDAKAERRTTEEKNEKTAKQEKAWVDWPDVLKRHQELKAEVTKFSDAKNLTPKQYQTLVAYVVLSFYVLLRPRRNADFLHMYVTPSLTDGLVTLTADRNYYALDTHKMLFHVFKTAKTAPEDEKSLDVPTELQEVIALYMKHHPLNKSNRKDYKLLVNADGSPINAGNSITRILNRVFDKHVSSSMLRHSFLSGKYGKVLEEMKEDSAAMAHGLNTQRNYIKMEGEEAE